MIDKKDILSGQHIWFADKSSVGQIKVVDIDKDDIVHYTSYDGNQYQKGFVNSIITNEKFLCKSCRCNSASTRLDK